MPRDAEDLLSRLDVVYDQLQSLNSRHQATGFGCRMSGVCCKVGLELHGLEIERLARGLEAQFAEDPARRGRVLARLVASMHDDAWNATTAQGDMMCALFENGCTVYGFRPLVCRMFGVVLEADKTCPRQRAASGRPLIFAGKDVDALVREYYLLLDTYGRRFPSKDWTQYMPAALLTRWLPAAELARLKRDTPAKLWRRSRGYRTQYVPSYRRWSDGRPRPRAPKLVEGTREEA